MLLVWFGITWASPQQQHHDISVNSYHYHQQKKKKIKIKKSESRKHKRDNSNIVRHIRKIRG